MFTICLFCVSFIKQYGTKYTKHAMYIVQRKTQAQNKRSSAVADIARITNELDIDKFHISAHCAAMCHYPRLANK